ncbi:MAG TPA: hypothetical protein VMS75_09930 [Terriglobales bacterium]|nr:hypothetical protein [Terriglobales bacterium]
MRERPEAVIRQWDYALFPCAILVTMLLSLYGGLWRRFEAPLTWKSLVGGLFVLLLPYAPTVFCLLRLPATASVAASLASLFCFVTFVSLLSDKVSWRIAVLFLPIGIIYSLASIRTWRACESVWLKAARTATPAESAASHAPAK